jgi:hypothetical protein
MSCFRLLLTSSLLLIGHLPVILPACNCDLLVSSLNIWNLSHFQIIYCLHTCFDLVLYSLRKIRRVKQSRAAWPLNMGSINCPETSVTNYQSTLHNIPEEQRRINCGGSLKLRIKENVYLAFASVFLNTFLYPIHMRDASSGDKTIRR